jgi:hypothetical protein
LERTHQTNVRSLHFVPIGQHHLRRRLCRKNIHRPPLSEGGVGRKEES